MKLNRGFLLVLLFGVICVAAARAQEPFQEAIPNWPAPATWPSHSVSRGLSTLAAITSPYPFIGLTPCRIVDTRGNGAPIQGGIFTGGSDVRDYAVAGICGIPSSAQALSLNFTVTGPGQTTAGFLLAWPTGGPVPPVSILNWDHVPAQVANAAVVPTNASVSFTVNVSAPTHVIIDVNGYYAAAGVGAHNTFLGLNAGNFTMTGDNNTGIGHNALSSNNTGSANTATGHNALAVNGAGSQNTATGAFALSSNSGGNSNTAIGDGALQLNTSGTGNTATGAFALQMNAGGGGNAAYGDGALQFNTGGNANIALGNGAGSSYLTTESSNICIGNSGVVGDSGTIRVGSSQTKTFVAGVNGVTTGGSAIPVLIDSNGQLGTVSSSARFKDEIQDMGEATEGLLKLRPVTFHYKAQPEGRTQFGLIAEEVEKVMPELVVCSASGEAETVLYYEMPAMLLNELQKQQRQIEELKLELAALRAIIDKK